MKERMQERCIYCGGDIYCTGFEKLVKCGFCGKTFSVMKFQSEQGKLRQALEEGEEAKAALAEAKEAQAESQRRLNAAVEGLSGLRSGQDTLSKMMCALVETQADSEGKLALLQGISARLLASQDDVLAKLNVQQEIIALLRNMSAEDEERRQLEVEFIDWSRSIQASDQARLEHIQSDAGKLLTEQRVLNTRVDDLQRMADAARKALDDFHDEYQTDKLKAQEALFRQAEDFQRSRRFDKAAEAYGEMQVKGCENVEISWRLVMCHYCMEYQRDDAGNLVPILLNPDLSAPEEIAARRAMQAKLDGDSAFYREELAHVDAILDKYREVRHRVQYDVFISVKQNVDGRQTPDSDKASDLYDYISNKGLRVFNSRRTPIPAGEEYEPYIISALMSAKVLIVVGTRPEYMNAQWVRNEWSRFQWLQRSEREKTGKTERVLFCYLAGGMQPKQIPKALHPDREAIIEGVDASNRLDRVLAFLTPKKEEEGPPVIQPVSGGANIDNLMKRARLFMEDGDWVQANEYLDKVLDENAEYAPAYVGKVQAAMKLHRERELSTCLAGYEKTSDWKRALRFATLEQEALYVSYAESAKAAREKKWAWELYAQGEAVAKAQVIKKRVRRVIILVVAVVCTIGYFAFIDAMPTPVANSDQQSVYNATNNVTPEPLATQAPTPPKPTAKPTSTPTSEPTPVLGPTTIAVVPFGESYDFTTQINPDGTARISTDSNQFETLSFTLTMKDCMLPSDFASKWGNVYKLQGTEAGAGFELTLHDYTGSAAIVPQNIIKIVLQSESGNTENPGFQLMDAEIAGQSDVSVKANEPKMLWKRYTYSNAGEPMEYLAVSTYNNGAVQTILFELESSHLENNAVG